MGLFQEAVENLSIWNNPIMGWEEWVVESLKRVWAYYDRTSSALTSALNERAFVLEIVMKGRYRSANPYINQSLEFFRELPKEHQRDLLKKAFPD